jgi:serine/threonine protein kinase/Tol biopolymer transport system component
MTDRWRQIEELYHQALERPEAERPAFLSRACGSDAELRDEIESLLRPERSGSFLTAPAIHEAAGKLEMSEALSDGQTIGSYTIRSLIGKGGMGEVYRARDSRLDRDVALKVLPASFAADPDRVARFDREARLLASLNHPNIATIHGMETCDDRKLLVLELVEGDTLADRMARGAIPVEESLKLARQIAEALEAAHERGIIHRDLKPANVKITAEGRVKVLDFGLAKAFEDRAEANLSSSPTLSMAATEAGMILGTAGYMAPEQASGEIVDRRADIWAFGVVLFEMLTGENLFASDQTQTTLARVLTHEIDWSRLPANLPGSVSYLLRRCLDRKVRDRLRDIGEARVILDDPLAGSIGPDAAPRLPSWKPIPAIFLIALILLLGVLAGAGLGWRLTRSVSDAPQVSVTSILIGAQEFSYVGRRSLAIAPTGTHVVYSAAEGIWVRRLADPEPVLVTGSHPDARSPFLSPDGQSVGYWADGALWKISLGGGARTRLVDSQNPWGASWEQDGAILYGQGQGGIWRVSDEGGEPEQIITVEDGARAQSPQLLPGGDRVLFTLRPPGIGSWNQAQVVVASMGTDDRMVLLDAGRDARYVSTGHIVYALNGALLAIPFDPVTGERGPSSERLLEGITGTQNVTGAMQFDTSDNGSLVYVLDSTAGLDFELTFVDRNGNEEPTGFVPGPYRHPRISPDMTRIVVSAATEGDPSILVGDIMRRTFTPLTQEANLERYPIWTPDGQEIVFFSGRDGGGLFRRRADATGPFEALVSGEYWRPMSWTSDGRLLYEGLAGGRIYTGTLPDEGEAEVYELVEGNYYDEMQPVLSPNGRWLAYHSTESGSTEVWIRSFPEINDKKQLISSNGGMAPVWSSTGDELYYLTSGTGNRGRPLRLPLGAMMAVRIETEPELSIGDAEELFSLRDYVFPDALGRKYDVTPDGRFLMIKDPSGGATVAPTQMVLIQNWFQELRERVPAL